jgi:transposase
MTKYREILRLHSLGFSQKNISYNCNVSKKTVNRIINRAQEIDISWPFDGNTTDSELEKLFKPESKEVAFTKRKPNFDYIHKELLKNGVNKKLLWTEYLEECRQSGEQPFMYSQFCYHIQLDEQKRHATLHINRHPGEQIEVDWAGDPATITDPDTGEILKAYLFVAVLTYSQYAYVEAFMNEKQQSWIDAHVHMYNFFGGVAKILVPDNCKTAVAYGGSWDDPRLNKIYYELAEHYGSAIIPARIRRPKDKPNVEGTVRNISTWITAALRNEQFFSLSELNQAIYNKLSIFNSNLFQKRQESRASLFHNEEVSLLMALPLEPYELATWKQAKVQFNYHISVYGMYYSVPYEYIKRIVDVRITDKVIEIFYNQTRIASHSRLQGQKNQYSTTAQHMPKEHQSYLEWNGVRFRKWAEDIGNHTFQVINNFLTARRVEQQAYRSCMGLLQLTKQYSSEQLECACKTALSYMSSPSYKSIRNILVSQQGMKQKQELNINPTRNNFGITRGSKYYGGKKS